VSTRALLPADQWSLVKELFDELEASPPEERAARLDAAGVDPQVRSEVRALLAAHDETEGFLEAAEPALLPEGRRLGPYEVKAHLGGGGMGDVYRARDTRLGRDVAIKVLRGRLLDDVGRARFEREARAIAALSHPNVLAVHDVGDEGGLPYLVTELLDGETLRDRLAKGAPTVALALEWASAIALGLAAAHAEGLVHRDLKPENVFLLSDGRVKILDFGLARSVADGQGSGEDGHTVPGMIVGTAGYLAPEQAQGRPVAASADLFALGAILFELLTGARAFRGATLLETMHAVVTAEPPPPSTLRPEVPGWLDRVVARCLCKDAGRRFQSAGDLAFALSAPPGGERAAPRAARWPLVAGAGALVAAAAIGFRDIPVTPARDPARPRLLTFSGRDSDPTVSPDGRFLAFASDRDGRSRIWLQQLEGSREIALTDGPDDAPRFSPDGSQLLFTRAHAAGTALYRVGLLGGEVHEITADATTGDWSPDGREVVFVRWRDTPSRALPSLMVANIDGSQARELARLEYRLQVRPRWSPDGSQIAVTGFGQLPGVPQVVMLVPVDGSPPRALPAASRVGLISGVAWDGPKALLYSQTLSVTGFWAGGGARVVRQRVDDGVTATLMWNMDSSFVLDRWPGRGVVFDARSPRQHLREVSLSGRAEVILSRGASTDRQPIFTPDGEHVVFSSNRGADLDVWKVSRYTGATQRLTDHPGDDWDPAFAPDGQLLWSSNRGGNFEVWMAEADGSRARQVTHDGVSAENPTATPDGWVVYSSGAPGRAGVWRIRPDGTDARLLVPDVILPEVSPDGRYVLFQANRSPRLAVVGVATIDGRPTDFEIRIDVKRLPSPALGRARWMPGGRAIAFLGHDEEGRTGVFVQPFAPGKDTSGERTQLAGFSGETVTESFGIAPDGERVVLAEWEQRSAVVALSTN